MTTITKAQNKRLHQLLSKLGYMEYKEQIVSSYSNGRVAHSSELYSVEADRAIKGLQAEWKKKQKSQEDKANTMRRKLIALTYQLNWVVEGKADMERLNNWCVKYGGFSKKLNEHTLEELPKVITQFEQMIKKAK